MQGPACSAEKMDTDETGNIMITNIIDEIIDNVASQNTELETDKLEGRSTDLREKEKGIQKVGCFQKCIHINTYMHDA